jgi:hypothetical protein
VVSYNSIGLHADKQAYLQHLLGQADLLMLQEHWLSSEQINKLQSDYPDFFFYGISGFDDSDILQGRPYGAALFFGVEISKLTLCQLPLVVDAYVPLCLTVIQLNYC